MSNLVRNFRLSRDPGGGWTWSAMALPTHPVGGPYPSLGEAHAQALAHLSRHNHRGNGQPVADVHILPMDPIVRDLTEAMLAGVEAACPTKCLRRLAQLVSAHRGATVGALREFDEVDTALRGAYRTTFGFELDERSPTQLALWHYTRSAVYDLIVQRHGHAENGHRRERIREREGAH